ncbi:MAG: alpha-1,2-fucosyltransferase [Prevotella sp.]|nr:alpha-1,2-fucosyltransferase [Bacteroides sp.]MCM1367135.1 alpha-1,2-fucosyltransferase [Prevotella sp.]MCM1437565.1 alpha-1,2-fucosyltransferase [Prevotella sp.]
MCNNLLQYGHVYALGREHGRRTISMRFAYKYPFFKISTMPGHNFFRYSIAKYGAKFGFIPIVSFNTPGEDCQQRIPEILSHRNVIVEGWEVRFYDLFLKYLDEIKQMFAFTSAIEARVEKLLKSSEGNIRIGLHIRRGDYARWQSGKYYYYDRQYIEVAQKIVNLFDDRRITVIVSGNDPELHKEAYRNGIKGATVEFANGNAGEDLCLLSKCNVLAGPPSTFSLVASMYNDIPLYWIKDPNAEIHEEDFGRFADLFRQII